MKQGYKSHLFVMKQGCSQIYKKKQLTFHVQFQIIFNSGNTIFQPYSSKIDM